MLQVQISIKNRVVRRAILIDLEVLHIAKMVAFRILQAVLLACGIEVRSRRLEVGPLALRHLMNVDGMLAGRQIPHIKLDTRRLTGESGWLASEGDRCRTHVMTFGVLEANFNRRSVIGEQRESGTNDQGNQGKLFHSSKIVTPSGKKKSRGK